MAFDGQLLGATHLQSFDRLYGQLPALFPPVPAALLHGDLWSGNFLCDEAGAPVLIDPAVYYGHPAMEGLFPSCPAATPSPASMGYLQPVSPAGALNLFGSGYLHDIEAILRPYR